MTDFPRPPHPKPLEGDSPPDDNTSPFSLEDCSLSFGDFKIPLTDDEHAALRNWLLTGEGMDEAQQAWDKAKHRMGP